MNAWRETPALLCFVAGRGALLAMVAAGVTHGATLALLVELKPDLLSEIIRRLKVIHSGKILNSLNFLSSEVESSFRNKRL
jgi:hypothetical protein